MSTLAVYWDRQYKWGRPIWDANRPASELRRVLREEKVRPCRALELGCGTGRNAVWLARRRFRVSAVDVSPTAIRRGRARANRAGVPVRFVLGDLRDAGRLAGPYDFFVDCGCYGAVQLADAAGYLDALGRLTRPGTLGLVLTGNADEPEDEAGPPVLTEQRLRSEFGTLFEIVRLRAFRFDAGQGNGKEYLGWSCLLRRRECQAASGEPYGPGTGCRARPLSS